jgi:DNA-directed RNA polymerase subunit L
MEIEVLQESSQGFEIKIIGEDHTFLNLLITVLQGMKEVDYAAYKIEHPLIGIPQLFFSLKEVSASEEIPIRKIKGVGPKTAEQLETAGIINVSQMLVGTPEKLAEKTGIALKPLSKYLGEARKMEPEDKYGYRAILKEALAELSKTLEKVKKGV